MYVLLRITEILVSGDGWGLGEGVDARGAVVSVAFFVLNGRG